MALGKCSGANEVNHPHSTVTAEIKKNNIYIYVLASRWLNSSCTNSRGAVYFICMVNNLYSFPSVIIGLTACSKHIFSVLFEKSNCTHALVITRRYLPIVQY